MRERLHLPEEGAPSPAWGLGEGFLKAPGKQGFNPSEVKGKGIYWQGDQLQLHEAEELGVVGRWENAVEQ